MALAKRATRVPSPRKSIPLLCCPLCRVQRDDLLKHCIDAHDGQVPLVICTSEPGDYADAVQLLRHHGYKITSAG